MLHTILRPILQLSFKTYFKRIYLIGRNNIPAKAPLLLACNHPNSFLDAILTGLYIYRPIHFLVRSDVFAKSWSNYILRKLKMLPIYRQEEGIVNLQKNDLTFAECNTIFEKQGAVLIFSEGKCVVEKRMRKLKKGTARLAFEAEQKNGFKLGLQIIPTGINYTYANKWGTEAFVLYGKPIPVKSFQEKYEQNPTKAILDLTNLLETEIAKLVIITPDERNDEVVEQVLVKARSTMPTANSFLVENDNRFLVEKKIAATTTLDSSQNEKSIQPKQNTMLKNIHFIFYCIGYLLNFLPNYISSSITNGKVKNVEFWASVRIATAIFLFIPYYLLLIIFCFIFFKIKIASAIITTVVLTGYISNQYFLKYKVG